MNGFLTKEELLVPGEFPEEEFTMPAGGKVLLRCLKPSERVKILYAKEEEKVILTLHFALKEPALSIPEARCFLDAAPFSALAVCRTVRRMARMQDNEKLNRKQEDEDRGFLTVLGAISRVLETKR